MIYVYKLYFAAQPKTIYIGITSNPVQRYREHRTEKSDSPKSRWVQNRQGRGWRLEMDLLQAFPEEKDALTLEGTLIAFYRSQDGYTVKNSTAGGERPQHSQEARQKMSEKRKQRPDLVDLSRAAGQGNRGKVRSQAFRDNLSNTVTLEGPDGQTFLVTNLKQWCKDQGLKESHLYATRKGQRRHHKGYRLLNCDTSGRGTVLRSAL